MDLPSNPGKYQPNRWISPNIPGIWAISSPGAGHSSYGSSRSRIRPDPGIWGSLGGSDLCANPTVFNNSPIRDTWPPGDFRCFRYGGYLGVLARPLLNPGSKNIDFLDFLKTPKRSIFPKSPGGPGGARGEAPGPGARGGRSRELQIRDPEFFSVFEIPGFSMDFQ